jgi:putative acetyltransferase
VKGIQSSEIMSNPVNDPAFFIRPATNADSFAIKFVVFTVLKEYGLPPDETGKDKDLNDIEKDYFGRNGFFGVLIERSTGNIVGTIGLFTTDANSSELRKMYLLKNHRGMGLGKRMLSVVLDFAKEKQVKRVTLETISPLKEAISLYLQFGFTEVPVREKNQRVDRAFELQLPG